MTSCRQRRLCMTSCRQRSRVRNSSYMLQMGLGAYWQARSALRSQAARPLRSCSARHQSEQCAPSHRQSATDIDRDRTQAGSETALPAARAATRAAAQLCSARVLAILVLLCHLGEVLQGAFLDPGLVARDVRVHLLVKAAPRDPVIQRHDACSRAGQEATRSGLSHKRAHVLHVVDEIEKVCAPHTALTPSRPAGSSTRRSAPHLARRM